MATSTWTITEINVQENEYNILEDKLHVLYRMGDIGDLDFEKNEKTWTNVILKYEILPLIVP